MDELLLFMFRSCFQGRVVHLRTVEGQRPNCEIHLELLCTACTARVTKQNHTALLLRCSAVQETCGENHSGCANLQRQCTCCGLQALWSTGRTRLRYRGRHSRVQAAAAAVASGGLLLHAWLQEIVQSESLIQRQYFECVSRC